jgi:hypothetical protein
MVKQELQKIFIHGKKQLKIKNAQDGRGFFEYGKIRSCADE